MIRKPPQMTVEKREKMRGGEGAVTIQHLLNKEDFGAKVRLCARLTLPPGAGIGLHPHETEDEVFVILKGAGILVEGASTAQVTEGDAILTGKGASHAIRNAGSGPLEILAMIVCY
jgi:mannose-6-phosphate isomerase-like protein (cupin superfamily)